ncbi:MAG: ABC transporter permease [Anaeromyxobacter sp.]
MNVESYSELRESFELSARPSSTSAWSAVATLAWRALLKIKHVPFQLFDVTVTPIMFTLLFTFMFGGALAGSPAVYIQYLLPGILVQTVLFVTVYTGVGINSDIQKGLYDRFRSLPIWQPAPVIGALAGDLFRYSMASCIILVLGYVLGFRPAAGVIGVLLALGLVLVFAFAVSWIRIIFGMKVKTPESVMTTSFVFLMPLTFASDIFVRLSTMPPWLQAIVRHNPVTDFDRRFARSHARNGRHGRRALGLRCIRAARRHCGAPCHAPVSTGTVALLPCNVRCRSQSAPARSLFCRYVVQRPVPKSECPCAQSFLSVRRANVRCRSQSAPARSLFCRYVVQTSGAEVTNDRQICWRPT